MYVLINCSSSSLPYLPLFTKDKILFPSTVRTTYNTSKSNICTTLANPTTKCETDTHTHTQMQIVCKATVHLILYIYFIIWVASFKADWAALKLSESCQGLNMCAAVMHSVYSNFYSTAHMMAPEYTGPRIGQLCLTMLQLMYVVHNWTAEYCV